MSSAIGSVTSLAEEEADAETTTIKELSGGLNAMGLFAVKFLIFKLEYYRAATPDEQTPQPANHSSKLRCVLPSAPGPTVANSVRTTKNTHIPNRQQRHRCTTSEPNSNSLIARGPR